MLTVSSINNLVISTAESASQTMVGQACFKLTDKLLWTIEKTAQWSLPVPETISAEENGKVFSKIELVRPLPWIIFLPSVIMLRVVRFGLNIAASIFGYPKVEPADMVHSIQKTRKRLRAIKSSGLKSMRVKNSSISTPKDRTMTMKEASKSLAESLRMTLSTLSCLDSGFKSSSPSPTKLRVSNILDSIQISNDEEDLDNTLSPKRKYSEIDSDDSLTDEEPILEKIERMTNEMVDDDDDDDYVPPQDESSESDSGESDLDTSISSTELQETLADKEEMEKTVGKAQEKRSENTDKNENKSTSEGIKDGVPESQQNLLTPNLLNKNHQLQSTTINGTSNSGEPECIFYSPGNNWKSSETLYSLSPDIQLDCQDVVEKSNLSKDFVNGQSEPEKDKIKHVAQ